MTARVLQLKEKFAISWAKSPIRGGVFSCCFSWRFLCLVTIGLALFALTGKGLTDRAALSLQGDMPRYLMNGVFFYDAIRDLPLSDPLQYAREYFAKYPALSIGHHPLLPSLAAIPFFFFFGVSVFSGKVTIFVFMLVAVFAWFELVKNLYGSHVAFLSSLLFMTSPMIVEYSRVMMSEIPALALIILASFWFFRYCEKEESSYAAGYVMSFVLACYAKQMVVFMFPIFFLYLGWIKGPRFLLSRETIFSFVAMVIFLMPLGLMTWNLSPTNVSAVTSKIVQPETAKVEDVEEVVKVRDPSFFEKLISYLQWKSRNTEWLFFPSILWEKQISTVPLVLSVGTMLLMLWRREKHSLYFVLWIMAMYGMVTYMGVNIPRLGIYWIPPFCLFAALSLDGVHSRGWRFVVALLLFGSIGYQFNVGYASEPDYAGGYEEAASYVVDHPKGTSILYSANVDTGYFTFFVRKLDTKRDLVILRADKVLSTSLLARIVEDKISARGQIYDILKDYGTCYVVMEEGHYSSQALNWLAEEVNGEKFIRQHTIPIRSGDSRLKDVNLGIFEYQDCGPPNPHAQLHFNIPLAQRSLSLKFSDVID